jgi:hypothetical protein
LSATQHQIPAGVKWLMVGDREADSYNLFAQATRTEADILVHAPTTASFGKGGGRIFPVLSP